ncbi:MAG: hypothetical protein LBO80_01140 [Treponema sp.]|jgi:hypothetical protein|nr:hypothetical protein [Treponema sp.]
MNGEKNALFAAVLVLLFCSTCGIDEYLYLDPPERLSISGDQAAVRLPNNPSYFLHYTVYYRIYISDTPISGVPVESQLTGINPLLYEDYSAIKRYTENENLTPPSTLFSGRHHFKLELASSNVDFILSSGLPATIVFNFPILIGSIPNLTHSGTSYNLYRSNNGFTPLPPSTSPSHRLFQNTADLNNGANAFQTDPNKNADVAGKDNMTDSFRYTYVSLYIMAEGIDDHYSPIYSRPTHVGVFKLPETSS